MKSSLSRLRKATSSSKTLDGSRDSVDSNGSSVSKSSRLKRLGQSGTKKKKSLITRSKSLFSKLHDKRPGSPKNSVLKSLIRHRKEYPSLPDDLDDSGHDSDVETVEIDDSASVQEEEEEDLRKDGKRRSYRRDDTKRRSYRRLENEPSAEEGEGEEVQGKRDSQRGSKRISSKRVSKLGFTSEEGLLERAEAMHFTNRYSLKRTRAMTAEEVIGRNSLSVKSLVRFAKHGDVEKVVALIQWGKIDVNASLDDGRTALMAAASHGHTATVVALYGLNADLEMEDQDGNTALIRAAERGHAEVVLTLLSCGADSTRRNQMDESALIVAAQQLGKADDKRSFEDYLEIVRAFFERAIPDIGGKAIPEYAPDRDATKIEDEATRLLLGEWLLARIKRKDLHMPSHSTFKDENKIKLVSFFHNAHARLDLYGWVKVTMLLLFIVYDTYSPHFSNTYTTLAVYVGLYLAAYNL